MQLKSDQDPSVIAAARMVAVGWALLSLCLAFICFTELSMLGFPDGYISPYDAATSKPLEIMAWLVVAQGVFFLMKGALGKKLRPAILLLQIFAIVAFILVPIRIVQTCPEWETCAAAYQAITGNFMDDGAGG